MTKYNVPGLSLAVTRNGKLIYVKGYGKADQEGNVAVSANSLFRVASVSKPITSVAVLKLLEEGKLKLDDKIFGAGALLGTEYGTQPYSANLQAITLKHLLTHTSGAWKNDANDPMFSNPALSAKDLITWTLNNRPVNTTPGTVYGYSNFGYCLLGRIIEKVSGKSYEDYVKTAVLQPSGITTMSIAGNTKADKKTNEVSYYGQNSENPYIYNISRMDAHGGWLASATDLAKLLVRVDGYPTKPDILNTASIQSMTTSTPSISNYALGWAVNSNNNWWHTGSLPGTYSEVVRSGNGFNWAILINTRANAANFDADFDNVVWSAIGNANTKWPDKDLF
ncbi:MAG: class A beta-lactamase-related serine hydrolase, partial [Chitinophagaceae bacterium]